MRQILFALLLFPLLVSAQPAKKFEFVFSIKSEESAVPNAYYSSENLFIRDMVIDPPQRIKIKLTKTERQQILDKIREINFFSYPVNYKFESLDTNRNRLVSVPSHCSRHTVNVFLNDTVKQVTWTDCHRGEKSKNNMYENLDKLSELIWSKIVSKKNFKKAKQLRAMYH